MNISINVFLVDIQLANGNAFFIFKKIGVIDIERGLVSLDYFYGQAGELFSFYRIPKALFQEPRFQSLSTDAKTLYGILLDRMSLSVKNGWLDEQNRVFILFTIEDAAGLRCWIYSVKTQSYSLQVTASKSTPCFCCPVFSGGERQSFFT